MNHRRPLRPGEQYLYQEGQIWEASVFKGPLFFVRLIEFQSEICSGIEDWLAERVELDTERSWRTVINTSHFRRGPLSEMAIIAAATQHQAGG